MFSVPKDSPNFDRHSSDEKHPGTGARISAPSVSKWFSPSPSVSTKNLFGLFCTTRQDDLLTQNVVIFHGNIVPVGYYIIHAWQGKANVLMFKMYPIDSSETSC